MKGTSKFFASLCVLCFWLAPERAFGQDELYPCSGLPYNIDVDCNGFINQEDLLGFLGNYGLNFTPNLNNLDIDLSNELQYLLLENDTLYLMLADSTTAYSQVYLGCAACEDGLNGLSAYELWLSVDDNNGTLEDFLDSLIGAAGADGAQGPQGPEGPAGADGAEGPQGPEGPAGADGAEGPQGPQGPEGPAGADGAEGLSAYEIWLEHGGLGSEQDFLNSLIGAEGPQGPQGPEGPAGADGAEGLSAYEIWLEHGGLGSETDFLNSLIGANGADGAEGPQGPQGPAGQDGAEGPQGPQGPQGPAGQDGTEGPQGPAGQDGAEGPQGPQGPEGPAGQDGAEGPQGPEGPAGADGAPGLSAYETWLSVGNVGTEEDFIAYLAAGGNNSPSIHGVFDSNVDGLAFEVTNAISTLSIELWGASGGAGGDVCGQDAGATSCNWCNATGGPGGRALKVISIIYNVTAGDVLELISADAGADSEELITCTPGLFGWTNWDCGPASSGTDGGLTQLLLNGELIAEISGGAGGTGGCIGCQGDGCFNGVAGSNGSLTSSANWVTILNSEPLTENTGSRLVIRY